MSRINRKAIWIVAIVILVLVALLELNEWWANIPPPRPPNVSLTAVYYGGLATPFPASKNGDWVTCRFDSGQNVDECRVTSVDGRLRYEGIYRPYLKQTPLPDDELILDEKAINRAQQQVEVNASSDESSEPGLQFVPLVYLKSGDVLIPASAYADGKKNLDELRAAHTP